MLTMTEGKAVTRYESVEKFLEAVKEISESTRCAWIFVDKTVEIPEEIAKVAWAPVGGVTDSEWALLRHVKETKRDGMNIIFLIEEDPQLVTFLGLQEQS